MTHAISVPTPFTDIAELAESFAPRVDEARIMLPNAQPIPEGEWVQFSVGFADGSIALNGVGRCTTVIDNGDAVAPEHRFDVVMDSLEFDEMSQVYFERILMVRAQIAGAEPGTGEVPVDEASPGEAPLEVDPAALQDVGDAAAGVETAAFEGAVYDGGGEGTETYDAAGFEMPPEVSPADAPSEASFEPPPIEAAHESFAADEPGATEVWDATAFEAVADADVAEVDEAAVEELEAHAEPVATAESAEASAGSNERLSPPVQSIYVLPPPAAPGELPSPHANGQALTRGAAEATWTPTPMLRPDPSPSSGLFQYGDGGLPQPERPPRPEIDPSLRVQRAPRPGDPVSVPIMHGAADATAGAVPVADEELSAAAEPLDAGPLAAESFDAEPLDAEPLAAEPVDGATAAPEGEGFAEAVEPPAFEAQYEAQPQEGADQGETRQVDISGLGGEYGDDEFDIPAVDEER